MPQIVVDGRNWTFRLDHITACVVDFPSPSSSFLKRGSRIMADETRIHFSHLDLIISSPVASIDASPPRLCTVPDLQKQTKGTNYRPDLESAALVRWSRVSAKNSFFLCGLVSQNFLINCGVCLYQMCLCIKEHRIR